MEYTYNDVEHPKLSEQNEEGTLIGGILYDVQNSDMTDKSIEFLTWNEQSNKVGTLQITFTNELSSEDKVKLDQIVEDNSPGE